MDEIIFDAYFFLCKMNLLFIYFFWFKSDKFAPLFNALQNMKLDSSPFVVISVIGQELLSASCFASSVIVLESALRIGSCSLKLRG